MGSNIKFMFTDLNNIKVKESYKNTVPSVDKMNECEEMWSKGKYRCPIIVNEKMVLQDGYTQHLFFKKLGIKSVIVGVQKKKTYRNVPTMYLFGKHYNSKNRKVYVWRIPKKMTNVADNIKIGDVVYCWTAHGAKPVEVVDIEILSKPPVDIPIKKICTILKPAVPKAYRKDIVASVNEICEEIGKHPELSYTEILDCLVNNSKEA